MNPLTPIIFSAWIIIAMYTKSDHSEKKVVSFLSKMSYEIYLLQMIAFRCIEKIGILHIAGNGVIGYICAVIMVLIVCVTMAIVWNAFWNRIQSKF